MKTNMPEYHYKIVTNSGWERWWGLNSDYEVDTQRMVDMMNSRGWDLHSFSLRNRMLPNVRYSTLVRRWVLSVCTLGFYVYLYGGVWVFKKPLKDSLSTTEPTL